MRGRIPVGRPHGRRPSGERRSLRDGASSWFRVGATGQPRAEAIRWPRIIKRLGAKRPAARGRGDKPKQANLLDSDKGD
jgi:hypothetical protein